MRKNYILSEHDMVTGGSDKKIGYQSGLANV